MHRIKNRASQGFTIIELIVVIAIIAILAGIVITNVVLYIGKAKEARANVDVADIEKALSMFYAQYGNYPYIYGDNTDQTSVDFSGSNDPNYSGTGNSPNPYLLAPDDTTKNYLSDLYNFDYNADYFVKDGYYEVSLINAEDNGGKIDFGYVSLYDKAGNFYGAKCIICQDLTDACETQDVCTDSFSAQAISNSMEE